MDVDERHRLEAYHRERVEHLAEISDLQRGEWRVFKARQGGAYIDMTAERIDELERQIQHLDALIQFAEHGGVRTH